MAKASFYTVLASLVGTLDGQEVEYIAGEVVDGDDPAVSTWPDHFGPLVVRDHKRSAPIEQATAAPGESRGHALVAADLRPKKRG